MAGLEAPIRVATDHERRYAGADRLATECVLNIVRAESLVAAELNRRFRRHGLSGAAFNVLMVLEGARAPLCPYEIGERLLVTRGTVTGLLDTLEKQGLIRRVPHPEDRRMLRIESTEKARKLLKEIWREHFPAEAEMMAVLTGREKDTLVRLLGKLQAHLEGRAERTAGAPTKKGGSLAFRRADRGFRAGI